MLQFGMASASRLNRQAELDVQAFPNGVWERETVHLYSPNCALFELSFHMGMILVYLVLMCQQAAT
jgi:hypothetical protein